MVNSNGLRGKLRQASLKVLGLNQFLKIVINVELPMCQSSGCVHLLSVSQSKFTAYLYVVDSI